MIKSQKNALDSTYEDFLSVSSEFRLGELTTEKSHRFTQNLSQDLTNHIGKAIGTLKQVDDFALGSLSVLLEDLAQLHESICQTLESGHRVFLAGCGATGRLSIALEKIFRETFLEDTVCNQVVSFMAGGDVALIQSIEKFEDFPEYGARQLMELGFGSHDLLIGITEGGETPWVIGATEKASEISKTAPFFLYCNPDEVLCRHVERSRRVIQDSRIKKINLTVGPMAIMGSTRMQASTILMMAVGLCLVHYKNVFSKVVDAGLDFMAWHGSRSYDFLEPFILWEKQTYKKGEFVLYSSASNLAIAVLTDTTERSPTFSLDPFEPTKGVGTFLQNPSLCYLTLEESLSAESAWSSLLGRPLRCFHWPEISDRTKGERALTFDFSSQGVRSKFVRSPGDQRILKISLQQGTLRFEADEIVGTLNVSELDLLGTHLVLKMLLNTLSTSVMGLLGRFEGNIMTYVKASNFKLIDRSMRYVVLLLQRRGIFVEERIIVQRLFELRESTSPSEPLVLKVVEDLTREFRNSKEAC